MRTRPNYRRNAVMAGATLPVLPVTVAVWFAYSVARGGGALFYQLCRLGARWYASRSRQGRHTRRSRTAAAYRTALRRREALRSALGR